MFNQHTMVDIQAPMGLLPSVSPSSPLKIGIVTHVPKYPISDYFATRPTLVLDSPNDT